MRVSLPTLGFLATNQMSSRYANPSHCSLARAPFTIPDTNFWHTTGLKAHPNGSLVHLLPPPPPPVTRVVCPLGPPVYAGSSTATQAPSPGRLQGRAALGAPWSPSPRRPSTPWAEGPVHDNTTSA